MDKIYCFRENKKEFGNNLKKIMKSKNMTIDELSELTGYDVNTIAKWRAGDRMPSLERLKDLADCLGITMQKLYLPNSYYEDKLSDELIDVIQQKKEIDTNNTRILTELEKYNSYLYQKMLFSFLTPSERKNYKSIFRYYVITSYGMEKLNLSEMSFNEFHDNFKLYIREQYGVSFPFKITLQDSIDLIDEFNKIVKMNYAKENVKL